LRSSLRDERLNVLIDHPIGERHQVRVGNWLQLRRRVSRLDDDEACRTRIEPEAREIGNVVVEAPARGKHQRDATDGDDGLSLGGNVAFIEAEYAGIDHNAW